MSETVVEYKQRIARSGGYGRAAKLTKKERQESAGRAVHARSAKKKKEQPA